MSKLPPIQSWQKRINDWADRWLESISARVPAGARDAIGAAVMAGALLPAASVVGAEINVSASVAPADAVGTSVAIDADGDSVVVYAVGAGGGGYEGYAGVYLYNYMGDYAVDIIAQRFDKSGAKVGGPILVNTGGVIESKLYGKPVVAMDDDGDFVVAWSQYVYEYSYTYMADYGRSLVFAQRFTAIGVANGSPIRVGRDAGQDDIGTDIPGVNPSIAMDADGDFAVVFQENYSSYDIYARLFSAGVAPPSNNFVVNDATPSSFGALPRVAMNAGGAFAVTFTDDLDNLVVKRFDAAGTGLEADFVGIDNLDHDFITESHGIAIDDDGDVLISYATYVDELESNAIVAKVIRPAAGGGFTLGPDIVVSPSGREFPTSSIAVDADGDFLVAWSDYADRGVPGSYTEDYFVQMRRFAADGTPTGPALRLNAVSPANPDIDAAFVSVALDDDGKAVFAWDGRTYNLASLGTFDAFVRFGDPNTAPVAQAGSLLTTEDTAASGMLGAVDDGATPVTFALGTLPTKGTVVLTNASTGAFTYTPNANANGADSFTFTANDGVFPESSATVGITITPVNDLPVITAATSAPASPKAKTDAVTFNAAATDIENETITFTWSFGDGTSGSGAAPTHIYANAGDFTVTVTATDASGGTATQSLTVNVRTIDGGTVTDNDGDGIDNTSDPDDDNDGLSDEFETNAGTDPLNGSQSPAGVKVPLTVSKAAVTLAFTKSASDTVSASGTLPVTAGAKVLNEKVTVDIGGVFKVFTLGKTGKAKSGKDSFGIAVKAKKGVVAAQTSKFTIKFSKGTFAAKLADEGLTASGSGNRTLEVTLIYNQTAYQGTKVLKYTAKNGKGTGK